MAPGQLGAVVRYLHHVAGAHAARDETDSQLVERFVARQDQEAFTALVRRHGRLVRSVCRHVLHQEQDCDDAFQATFLVFARRAGSIRKGNSVASWLYGVAFRTAMNTKRTIQRRREKTGEVQRLSRESPVTQAALREVQAILDEEVNRLPAKYRTPLVLCCLEGKSVADTARELGWKEGTVSGRLARARKTLQQRLARRGVALSAALCAAALGRDAVAAAVSPTLAHCTIKAAISFAAGKAFAADLVSAEVTTVAKGVLNSMALTKGKIATALLLAATVGITSLGVLRHQVLAGNQADTQQSDAKKQRARQAEPASPLASTKADTSDSVRVHGRVLGPDGKPLAGAKLYLGPTNSKEPTFPVRATSGADGRFDFTFARSELDKTYSDEPRGQVLAMAKNLGCDLAAVGPEDKDLEVTLRLGKDIPINGRILDQDGRVVTGAKVHVDGMTAYPGRDLKDVLEDFREGRIDKLNQSMRGWSGPLPGQPNVLTTGADGRFRLTGLGPDRIVGLHIESPRLVTTWIHAMTRPGDLVMIGQHSRYYPNAFDHVAPACRPIRGVVRDKVTGKPVAGVEITTGFGPKTQTDHEGKYELLGLPKSENYQLEVRPPNGQLYFAGTVHISDTPGFDPVAADIELVTGIPLRGHVTDKTTGKPVSEARLEYHALFPNPHIGKLAAFPGGYGPRSEATTGPDGSFALVALPGPGMLGVAGSKRDTYLTALVTHKDLQDFFKGKVVRSQNDDEGLDVACPPNAMSFIVQQDFNALVLLDPEEKAESLTRDVVLEPARTVNGSVAGPDGKPLTGVTAYGLNWRDSGTTLKSSTFTVRGLNPRRARRLLFLHKEKNLGCFIDLKGDETGPLTVTLQPCGSATGQLVDKDGQPVAGMDLQIGEFSLRAVGHHWYVKTGADGRFHVEGVVAGAKLGVMRTSPFPRILGDFVVEPAKNKDLGKIEAHLDDRL